MGPKNGRRTYPGCCDRPQEQICNRTSGSRQAPPRQFEIIPDCPRMDFCTRAAASVDKFLSITRRRFSPNLACGLCTKEIASTCFATPRPSGFLPLDQSRSEAVTLRRHERLTRPSGNESGVEMPPHRSRGSLADLEVVARRREDAVGDEAHHDRIRRRSRTCSPSEEAGSRKISPISRSPRNRQAVTSAAASGYVIVDGIN